MDQKQPIVDRLKQANNILVTVSSNPSVDQLASCIGLTLALNKMGKHATAVFSGAVPSTLEFLQPEKTIETNTDSLRDFIISLDKTKADKLRYKVEDTVVKIFITPYRTSISDKDLEFSQGDFNVDAVVALGVHNQSELDQTITSHGRILHDATVATINVKPGGELGSMNWLVPNASSLSELVTELVDTIDKNLFDAQIATALLTGIVAETGRFGNEKTSPTTMSISAQLMAAGANQQLVATKLEEPKPEPPAPAPAPATEAAPPSPTTAPVEPQAEKKEETPAPDHAEAPKTEDGTLEISHNNKLDDEESKPVSSLEDLSKDDGETEKKPPEMPKIQIDDQGSLRNIEEVAAAEHKEDDPTDPNHHVGGSRMILQPPTMGGTMSASGMTDDSYSDPLSLPQPGGSPQESPSGQPASYASPASATISAAPMPFMPASMTPPSGQGLQPVSAPFEPPKPSDPGPSPFQPPTPTAPSPSSTAPPTLPSMDTPAPGTLDFSNPSAQPVLPPAPDTAHVDNARDAVSQALASQVHNEPPQPIHALNAQPLGDPLRGAPMVSDNGPPDLTAPVPAEAPQPAAFSMPAPVGPPPPGPPPMMPTPPQ